MELKNLKKEHFAILKKWIKTGEKCTTYKCSYCEREVQTLRPTKQMVDNRGYWDSVKICPECSRLSFVKVYPDGKTKSYKLN